MVKKSKMEYNSSDESVIEEVIVAREPELTTEPQVVNPLVITTKEKKPRTQKQIDATLRMRDNLKAKQLETIKIKEQTKLEHDTLMDAVKEKLIKSKEKKKVNKRVDEQIEIELEKKLKEFVDNDSSSDEESEEEEIVKPKARPKTRVRQSTAPQPQQRQGPPPMTINFV